MDDHFHDGDESSNDHDIAGDADVIGDDLAEQGDQHVGADQHRKCGQTHAQRTCHVSGSGKGGTGSQNENENGVLLDDTLQEDGQIIIFHQFSPPSRIFTASKQRSMAFRYPLLVIP